MRKSLPCRTNASVLWLFSASKRVGRVRQWRGALGLVALACYILCVSICMRDYNLAQEEARQRRLDRGWDPNYGSKETGKSSPDR